MDKAKIYVHDSNATTPQQQRSMKTKKRPYPNRELDPSFSDKETEIEDVHKKRPKRRGKKVTAYNFSFFINIHNLLLVLLLLWGRV